MLFLWPKSPACRFLCLFPTFYFCYCCVLFVNHSLYFLSANNEQWLTHTVGNYLLKEVKVNVELIIVYSDWICPLNWTLEVERQNVSVAGAILLCTSVHSHWVRSMVHPGLWRPTGPSMAPGNNGAKLLCWKEHPMAWAGQEGWCKWDGALSQVRGM